MIQCEAIPNEDAVHDGTVGAYIRLCPAGHIRTGTACSSCAGIGAIICNECEGGKPAILIPAAIFATMALHVPQHVRDLETLVAGE